MQKFKCDLCGYVYDLEKGDPDNWVCPECGAEKSDFSPV